MLQPAVPSTSADLVCLSHLRWNFVFQRPQHLMTRCARDRRVFFVEEPVFREGGVASLHVDASGPVTVAVPQLPAGLPEREIESAQRALLDQLFRDEEITEYILWYYTPMALAFTDHLRPAAIVYDCMDELSAFKGAPAVLGLREAQLMRRAALVLTGGHSLFEAKRDQHANIHPLPSSVDLAHFGAARRIASDPPDQAPIARPRLGFFGVIDERMDLALVDGVAASRPNWQLVLIGPVVKIDEASLPRRPNIHYLDARHYSQLPHYLAGWDVALLPFARNEATRFISPTKTPEYLAAGKPVVSTSIRDVVRPYGDLRLVRIADDVAAFVAACEAAMREDAAARIARADGFLARMSWDGTWGRVRLLLDEVLSRNPTRRPAAPERDLRDGSSAVA